MVPLLAAIQFQRFMNSGRTLPAIFGCEDEWGTWVGEYVVKLRGGIETTESGLLRELVAARLAAHFGIASPDPAIVGIDEALAELIAKAEPSRAAHIRNSIGLNCGTRLVRG